MTTEVAHHEFIPGTTGWTIDDLDDPEIDRLWSSGRYEIVEGVLTLMAPAAFDGGIALKRLCRIIEDHTVSVGLGDGFAFEVDIILNKQRLPVADAVFLSLQDQEQQKRAHAARGRRPDLKYGRVLIPPSLVIESVSWGHESHDRETKRRWYAEGKIPNYWILDAQEKSLECLVLEGQDYRLDQAGRDREEVRPAAFGGLVIPLAKLWAD